MNGAFFVHGLAPGTYRVEFAIPGFSPMVREGLDLRVGGTAIVGAPSLDTVHNLVYVGTDAGIVYALSLPLLP